MNKPKRFNFMFTPNFWALPVSIGWQRAYYGSGKQVEMAVGIGPFGLSVLIGALDD